jgi:hypothetical protein
LQFPPKITKDERTADIEAKELYTGEPTIVYKTYSSRKLTMEMSYIVEDHNEWSASRIAGICKRLRGYYTLATAKRAQGPMLTNFLVTVNKLWLFGGYTADGRYEQTPQFFIFKSIGISHSDTLVSQKVQTVSTVFNPNLPGVTDYQRTFHLKTDITIEMWAVPFQSVLAGDDKKTELSKDRLIPLEWY